MAEYQQPITSNMLGEPEGPDDLYSLMSEADRVRISYQLLLKMKLEKQIKTKSAFDDKTYPRMDP